MRKSLSKFRGFKQLYKTFNFAVAEAIGITKDFEPEQIQLAPEYRLELFCRGSVRDLQSKL